MKYLLLGATILAGAYVAQMTLHSATESSDDLGPAFTPSSGQSRVGWSESLGTVSYEAPLRWASASLSAPDNIHTFVGDEFQQAAAIGDAEGIRSTERESSLDFSQDPNGEAFVYPGQTADTLWILNSEENPSTGLRKSYFLQFPASFEIVDFTYRCEGDFLVVGTQKGGTEVVLERWYLDMPDGAWVARRPASPSSTPASANYGKTIESIQGGGVYVPVKERTTFPTMRRFRIPYASSEIPIAVEVDPDARFVYLSYGRRIVQVHIATGAEVALLDESSIERSGDIDRLTTMWIPGSGRALAARGSNQRPLFLFFDSDNDGVFESQHESATFSEYLSILTPIASPKGRF